MLWIGLAKPSLQQKTIHRKPRSHLEDRFQKLSPTLLLVEAVRASNDDVELLTVLALVRRGSGADRAAPERALDLKKRVSTFPSTSKSIVAGFTHVGSRQRVRARRGRVKERVALEVDVKGVAAAGVVAVLAACGGVVGLQEVVAHVAVLLRGAVLVAEGRLVALGRRGGEGEGAVGRVG